jgi:hypothetical protein
MDIEARNNVLKNIKEVTGASNRQLSRVLNIGRGILEKISSVVANKTSPCPTCPPRVVANKTSPCPQNVPLPAVGKGKGSAGTTTAGQDRPLGIPK